MDFSGELPVGQAVGTLLSDFFPRTRPPIKGPADFRILNAPSLVVHPSSGAAALEGHGPRLLMRDAYNNTSRSGWKSGLLGVAAH